MEPPVAHARRDAVVRRELVVIGASAGGVEALTTLVRGLPTDIPLAFAVVLHLPAGAESRLPEILGRAGPLRSVSAEHGMEPEPGVIYVARPDYHLVLSGGRMFLLDGPRENGFRPGVDPLFRSAARDFGPRAIGVVLSGTMDDGAAGLAAIRSFGGATVVQDPEDALASGMPQAAIDAASPDHVVPATAIGGVLEELARTEVQLDSNVHVRHIRPVGPAGTIEPGDPTLIANPSELEPFGVDLSCPECGGALQGILTGPLTRYRCRTGHVYSPITLLDTKSTELEAALYAALRALEEEATVAGRLAVRSRDSGATSAARRFEMRQGDAAQRADLIRQAIHSMGETAMEPAEETPVLTQPGTVEAL